MSQAIMEASSIYKVHPQQLIDARIQSEPMKVKCAKRYLVTFVIRKFPSIDIDKISTSFNVSRHFINSCR